MLHDVKYGDGTVYACSGSGAACNILVKMGVARTLHSLSYQRSALRNAVGNSLEVAEAIDVLKGKGPADITEISTMLAGAMIYLGCKAKTPEEGYAAAEEIINSGAGLAKFRKFVSAQGGDPAITEDVTIMGTAAASIELVSDTDGIVQDLSAERQAKLTYWRGARLRKRYDWMPGYLRKSGDAVKKENACCSYGDEEKYSAPSKNFVTRISGQKQPSPRKLYFRKIRSLILF